MALCPCSPVHKPPLSWRLQSSANDSAGYVSHCSKTWADGHVDSDALCCVVGVGIFELRRCLCCVHAVRADAAGVSQALVVANKVVAEAAALLQVWHRDSATVSLLQLVFVAAPLPLAVTLVAAMTCTTAKQITCAVLCCVCRGG